MEGISKNMHIMLFEDNGVIKSERLVKQDPEFNSGPKEKHNGPMRISFSLVDKKDVEKAITYLEKLSLDLPLGAIKKPVGRQPSSMESNLDYNRHEQVLKDAIDNSNNQDEFIKSLRELGFIFTVSEHLKLIIPEAYEMKKIHLDNYEWLIRRTKEAKVPTNDKFDPQLLIGIKIMEGRSNKVVIYLNGEYKEKKIIKIPTKKALTVKNTNLIKYPDYMLPEERLMWGNQHRALFNDPSKKPSKFYMRWVKDIEVGRELKIDIKSRIKEDES